MEINDYMQETDVGFKKPKVEIPLSKIRIMLTYCSDQEEALF